MQLMRYVQKLKGFLDVAYEICTVEIEEIQIREAYNVGTINESSQIKLIRHLLA